MPNGYRGKILRVNLTDGNVHIENQEEPFYRRNLGGRNIVGHYLLREVTDDIDALSPGNLLIYATSILTGLPSSAINRHTIGSKSPVTGGWADSEVGGSFGPELKSAGFDALVIAGKAPRPVYLWIRNGEAELRDAAHLWGKTTGEAQMSIREELGDVRIRVSQIGPAGERLIPYACIIEDLHHAAGRNGLGAVMGSKNLKAVAVRGSGRFEISDREAVLTVARKFVSDWKKYHDVLGELGTSGVALVLNGTGEAPTRNFTSSTFEGMDKISGQAMRDTILIRREGCYGCAIHCKRVVEASFDGRKADPMYGGPEYESVASFGANLGNESLESIAVANALCNANGLDIISAGGMIAFVTECFEKGLIDSSKTDGQALKFGDPNAMLVLLQKIISRTGVGDVLAAGVERVREYFGPECERYLMAVKGQFMAYHEPRTKFSLGLGNAVAPGGADHLQTVHDQKYATAGNATAEQVKAFGVLEPLPAKYLGPEKVRAFYYLQQWESLVSILGACFFACTAPSVLTQDDIVSLARAATGWNISLWELMKAGERGLMMAHLFNLRNGVGPSDDTLPERFFEAVADGPSKGARLDRKDFESARRLYYEMMGWDPVSGVPLKGRLAELGLEWAGEEEREHSTMP